MDAEKLKRFEAHLPVAVAEWQLGQDLEICQIPAIESFLVNRAGALNFEPMYVLASVFMTGFRIGRSFERSEQLERLVK